MVFRETVSLTQSLVRIISFIFFFNRNKNALFPKPRSLFCFWFPSIHGSLNKAFTLFILRRVSSSLKSTGTDWQRQQIKTYKLLLETRVNVFTIVDHRPSHRSAGASGEMHKSKPTPALCFLSLLQAADIWPNLSTFGCCMEKVCSFFFFFTVYHETNTSMSGWKQLQSKRLLLLF